jgi:2,5-diketo-D-gluconate reductase A
MIFCVETTVLNSGAVMPRMGFGCMIPQADTTEAVARAIEVGYRSLDTASEYGNEVEAGRAIAAADVPRDELFVTTKLWNTDHGREKTLRAFDASLDALGLEHVDLYLIHWPVPAWDLYVETWRALVELQQDGRARAIGVSNFQIPHLERIVEATGVVPAVNQIELHPLLQQGELRAFHAHTGIVTEAWSPLAQGVALSPPTVRELAERHERSPGQIVLRWHLQLGSVAIPKSVTPQRIAENFDVLDFELDEHEMDRLQALDADTRTGPHPDTFIED